MSDTVPSTDLAGQLHGQDEFHKVPRHPVCVLLSGGLDSSACIRYYVSRGYDVSALFIDYGQPNADKEAAAATAVAKYYDIELRQVQITGPEVSSGYVPARNALLLSLALMKTDLDAGLLAIGIHAGTPYVDCSPQFVQSMQRVIDLYTEGCLRIDAPFINWKKGEICDYARSRGVPLHLVFSSNSDDLPSIIRCRYHED